MSDTPTSPAGNGIQAIGLVSVNYSRLEFAMRAMFTTITGCPPEFALLLIPKIQNPVRTDLMMRNIAPFRANPLKQNANAGLMSSASCLRVSGRRSAAS
jgi:hypothetical protein